MRKLLSDITICAALAAAVFAAGLWISDCIVDHVDRVESRMQALQFRIEDLENRAAYYPETPLVTWRTEGVVR